MKTGWKAQLLGSLFQIGSSKRVLKSQWTTEGVPFYRGREVTRMSIDGFVDNELFIAEDHYAELARQYGIPQDGDIIITAIGTIGNSYIVQTGDRFYFKDASVLWMKKTCDVSSQFINYWLKSPVFYDQLDRGNGATVDTLTIQKLQNVQVLTPPLAEQQRIVTTLDEAFESIATARVNAEQNLQNARALFESYLQSIFTHRGEGWEDAKIGQHIRFIDYRGKTPTKMNQGLRLITAKNVKMGYVQQEPMEFVAPESYAPWMTRGIPRRGDILFTTEAPLANVAQLDTDEKVVFAQRIIIMQPDASKLDSTFLKYLLLSQPIQQRIRAKGTGATVQGIKASLLRLIDISFPTSLPSQRKIVEMLDSLNRETQRLESIYQQKLAALDELKKSLLHQAFSGELTKHFNTAVVIPFPKAKNDMAHIELHAGLLAIAYQRHQEAGSAKFFHHVKSEKIVHMAEAYLGIDLGRTPIKDAAGPSDKQHRLDAENWAYESGFFSFKQVDGGAYDFKKLPKFDALVAQTKQMLGDRCADLDRLLQLMLTMDMRTSELLATVYAAWNNLLLLQKSVDDEGIVLEARENWHPDKKKIPRSEFFDMIAWIKQKNIIPLGRGKFVGLKNSPGNLLDVLDN
ncbi:restriction endonuclease subunit S [Herminiimonas arsenitoxidans]|uniref:restriction endonuclease subunit S n=1 Tax=Herminiimonas arsenitoxidans TaxID=1809410 RepID=UPI0009712EF6|nr:restriction endonuclease subunit S [Herminiimonas arsenitoxidans]